MAAYRAVMHLEEARLLPQFECTCAGRWQQVLDRAACTAFIFVCGLHPPRPHAAWSVVVKCAEKYCLRKQNDVLTSSPCCHDIRHHEHLGTTGALTIGQEPS